MIDPRQREGGIAQAAQAGLIAALVMLAVQLIWRLAESGNGVVQAFPEFIVAAISRLTPLSVFGTATESYGSLAKKSLFVAVLIGIVAVGYAAGAVAGQLTRRTGQDGRGRLLAGGIVAAGLLLFTLVVVMPIAHLGIFATESSYMSEVLFQLIVTFAIFAATWALLAVPETMPVVHVAEGDQIDRRDVLGRTAWAIGTLASIAAVGGLTWRLLHPRPSTPSKSLPGQVTAEDETVKDIVATQRAQQGYTTSSSTPTPVSEATTRDVAELQTDAATASPDPFALFNKLEANGDLTPVLTSVDDFYHVSKNIFDPTVKADGWTLTVTGLVEKDLKLTYDEVVKRATTKKITTLSCISNELNGNLISTAEWTGFPLHDLLMEAGINENAVDIKVHCADDYEESFPVAAGLDPDTLVVVGMNGKPLRDDHGFPARIIVPGIYGMKNVKWLEKIEVIDNDFKGYWETRGWSDSAIPQIWGRIDNPSSGEGVKAGQFIAAGMASAGDRGISRVEVSLDDGKTWADATLEPALNPPFTWVRWAYTFNATDGKHKMRIRATDGKGQVATKIERSPLPDGATGWPDRTVNVSG
jgi:DMSO/TMAO reductase YedYZ molybdopterin-dependent catalytic subunit